jgi:hypothetical protein
MPNLVEVRLAIKNKQDKEALRMLKVILKEKPRAEAWYLAARLTSDRELALTYCKRALMFDSQYREARLLLAELGGRQQPSQNKARSFVEAFVGFFQDFGDNIPGLRNLLRPMHPNVRGALVASMLVLLIAVILVIVSQI